MFPFSFLFLFGLLPFVFYNLYSLMKLCFSQKRKKKTEKKKKNIIPPKIPNTFVHSTETRIVLVLSCESVRQAILCPTCIKSILCPFNFAFQFFFHMVVGQSSNQIQFAYSLLSTCKSPFTIWIVKKRLVMEDHGSRIIDVESDVEALEQCMKAELRSDSPLSATCCIFRVPEVLRRRKPEAYAPDVVSIGPFHHRSSKLFATMKDVKQWYLNSLLLRNNVSLKALIQGIDNITGFEKRARDYYAESIDHLNRNEFIEMMIIDGCFLLELFQRSDDSVPDTNYKRNDPLSNMSCMVQYLCHDLMLLENQLPWFVLESLYGLTCDEKVPLTTLVLDFFSRLSSLHVYCNGYSSYKHDDETLHILDLIRSAIVVPFQKFESFKCDSALPHATALLESAGIEFKRSFAAGLMSIDFKDGVLKIPQLEIAEMTEPLFRNLIAFEQCYHGRQHLITSYALLMDKLIASSEDVVLLCDRRIIHNWLGAEDVSQLFSTLYSDTLVANFCYGGLCAEVNEYYKGRWNQWLARLKHDYLSDPWKIISLVAAVILLVLTLLQTMYTIQQ